MNQRNGKVSALFQHQLPQGIVYTLKKYCIKIIGYFLIWSIKTKSKR